MQTPPSITCSRWVTPWLARSTLCRDTVGKRCRSLDLAEVDEHYRFLALSIFLRIEHREAPALIKPDRLTLRIDHNKPAADIRANEVSGNAEREVDEGDPNSTTPDPTVYGKPGYLDGRVLTVEIGDFLIVDRRFVAFLYDDFAAYERYISYKLAVLTEVDAP